MTRDYAAGGVIKDDTACHGAIPCTCPTTFCLYRLHTGESIIRPRATGRTDT